MSMQTTTTDWNAIAGVYELFARLWIREVDLVWLEEMAPGPVKDAFVAIGGVVPEVTELDDLATEYCRLFIGPTQHSPPLQSVWAQASLQSEVSASVRDFAAATRFASVLDGDQTLPDHLGIQLEMMAHMVRLIAADPESAALPLAAEFFRRHLTWVEPLTHAIQQRAERGFYEQLAKCTQTFLMGELAIWNDVPLDGDANAS